MEGEKRRNARRRCLKRAEDSVGNRCRGKEAWAAVEERSLQGERGGLQGAEWSEGVRGRLERRVQGRSEVLRDPV